MPFPIGIHNIILKYLNSPVDKFNLCKVTKVNDKIETLRFNNLSIHKLNSAKLCPKLKILSIQDSIYPISSINIISEQCKNINILNLHGSRVLDSIEFIFNLPNLKYLDLCHSNTKESFVSNINRLPQLKLINLYVSNCLIHNMAPYLHIKSLKLLDLTNNRISIIPDLRECKSLITLYLTNNSIRNITPLSELVNLKRLTLSGNRISNITPLSGLTKLNVLELEETYVRNIMALYDLPLKYLNIKHTFIDKNNIPRRFIKRIDAILM